MVPKRPTADGQRGVPAWCDRRGRDAGGTIMHNHDRHTLDRRRVLRSGLGGLVAAGGLGRIGPAARAQSAETEPGALAAGIARAAEGFLDTLDESGLARATYSFDDPE